MHEATNAVAAFLAARTGLALSVNQRDDLSRYLEKRVGTQVSETSIADCVARFHDPAEFRALVDLLTVKETYFYRHETQFEALRDNLLARFATKAAAEGRPVRLWSAGCCTGEEPYTLAIIAAERGLLDSVEILGTDINERYLEVAMAGAYTARALRQLPGELVERYFVPRGDRFVIADEIRARVTFKYLNLAEGTYPSFLNGTNGLDAIFCRNVLIYFDKTTVGAIVSRFADCIQNDGLVAFGHSEMLSPDAPLVAEQSGEAFFYGRRREPPIILPVPPIPPASSRLGGPVAGRSRDSNRPKQLSAPALPAIVESASDVVMRAGRAADLGRSTEAVTLCREALQRDPELVTAHYLLGLMAIEKPAEAVAHLRRVVYLDPGHLTARLHLAQCLEALGEKNLAIREYTSLERLAAARPSEVVLDPREGITFGMLAALAKSARQRIAGTGPGALPP
jgi:chemotaxis protein methyltransferase CheR